MLVSPRKDWVDKARFWSTQARDPDPAGINNYVHREAGYNYRLSNVLAGIGRGQLRSLSARIERRREIFEFYRQSLGDLPGVAFMPEAPGCHSTRWLTCLTIDPDAKGSHRDAVLAALETANIEARPLWKPLHQQPLYRQAPCFDAGVADRLFAHGLSLPSGSGMTEEELDRVVETVRGAFQS
jgi:pyridoxal phosphate-dependent aminotransferase EpsN